MIGYLRPFWDKLKVFRLKRWVSFYQRLSAETDGFWLWKLPKIVWGQIRGFDQHEFFRYRVPNLSWAEMASYHATFDNVRLIGRLNREGELWRLRDKGAFLKRFSHRLGREFIDLREVSETEFGGFLKRHTPCVAKPFNRAHGSGIEVLEGPRSETEIASMYRRYMAKEIFVVESFLTQHPALSAVYPLAVNSMRLTTLLTDGESRLVLPPTVRFGRGGCRIDMIGSITALIDRDDEGRVAAVVDDAGNWISHHPDSGEKIVGIKVPFLREAEALVLSSAKEIPEVRYVGWDVAITPAGPVLIEGNGAPGVVDAQLLQMKVKGDGFRWQLAALR